MWQPPWDICPASLSVSALCKRKERKWLFWRLTESHSSHRCPWIIQASQGISENSGRLNRGPRNWALLLEREGKWPCAEHHATGIVLGPLSHLSLMRAHGGKCYSPHFIRRKFKDHITVKSKAGIWNQFSPAPKHCLLERRKSDLRSGLTSHTYIFYLGSGLETHASIILFCKLNFLRWKKKNLRICASVVLTVHSYPWQLGKQIQKT